MDYVEQMVGGDNFRLEDGWEEMWMEKPGG